MPDDYEKSLADLEKYWRLKEGPLRLPKDITAAHSLLRLFVTYLQQTATLSALQTAASNKKDGGSREESLKVTSACRTLAYTIGIPHTHKGLCCLVSKAPALACVAHWARRIDDWHVIPAEAIPSKDLVDSCTRAYQQWQVVLSKTPQR